MKRTAMSLGHQPTETTLPVLAVRVWPDLGQILGVGKNTCYRLVSNGEIKSIRVGSRIIVPLAAVEAYLRGEDHA